MRDPNVLSIPQAAKLAGKDAHTFAQMLRGDPSFAAKIVIDLPAKRVLISRPRLMRHLHGEHWKEDLGLTVR